MTGRWSGLIACLTAVMVWTTPSAQGQVRSELVATGLSAPLGIVSRPDDPTKLFIVQQTGLVRIVNLPSGSVAAAPFIDISGVTNPGGEQGLLGLVFDPEYLTNGFFYLNYTDLTGANVIARYQANAPFATATSGDLDSAVVMRVINRPFGNHNAGHMEFGPDGMLYAGVGDGGASYDPYNYAQNTGVLLGKMLRLDVRNQAGDWVAADNPFTGSGDARADDIWAFGLRNPWKFNFDKLTGDLWIADVGQIEREEINFQPALTPENKAVVSGRNYGWDCREGLIATPGVSGLGCDPNATGVYTDPIIDFIHTTGDFRTCSITGGVVYRGTAIPDMVGTFLSADFCAGWIKGVRYDGAQVTEVRDWTAQLSTSAGPIVFISSFGTDAAGEVYFCSIYDGHLYKIVPDSGNCGCPCALEGPQEPIIFENFQAESGWEASATASAGAWVRATPINSDESRSDPVSDGDGSGQCFVTGNGATEDVDGGSTSVVSPEMDWRRGEITLCYSAFLFLASEDAGDGLFVDVSSNGMDGPWRRVASHTSTDGLAWIKHVVTDTQLKAAGVLYSAHVRVRFTATDEGADSDVEAGVDAVKVYTGNPFPDCNTNGVSDQFDLSSTTSFDCNFNGIPDECDIATNSDLDQDGGPVGVRETGAVFFADRCAGCHGTTGTGGTGPNIRNVARTMIRNRLTFSITHPGGVYPGLGLPDFANIEAFLADAGSKGRPDGVPDACQSIVLRDCDGDGKSDGLELARGESVDLDYDGLPDGCTKPCIAFTSQPISATTLQGGKAMMFATATGTSAVSYQWRRNGVALTNGGSIQGATSHTLVIDPVNTSDAGSYSVRVTSDCGIATSQGATLNVRPAFGTALGRPLWASSGSGLNIGYSSDSFRPVVLQLSQNGTSWSMSALDTRFQVAAQSNDTIVFTDPGNNHSYAAVIADTGTYVVDLAGGGTADPNLTARIPGATRIDRGQCVFTFGNSVLLGGIDPNGDVVLYFQTEAAEPGDWAFANLSRDHVRAQGQTAPEFVSGLVGYSTPWGGLNIAGLDSAGSIRAIWWSPGLDLWRTDDISSATGTPPIRGSLTAYVTAWGAITIAGVDDSGALQATWWSPALGDQWAVSDMSSLFGGPELRTDSLTSFVTPWNATNIAGADASGNVVVYWWAPGMTDWVVSPMADIVSNAPLSSSSMASTVSPTGVISIVGTNFSGQVFRFYWAPGAQWKAENISANATLK